MTQGSAVVSKKDVEGIVSDATDNIKTDVELIVKNAVDDLSQIIAAFGQNVHDELVEIRTDIADIRTSLDRLTNTIDSFAKRLDDQDIENTARDAQHRRLLAWAEKVSAKTGIPLEY
ncbi:hypothetical protein EKI60_00680 [Candidatus Saccharibacteria bacterium]|nr:MAG: hypothetical protein EKI60_00680 [Candidatus Saccharibacteria bacterium]